MSFYGDLVVTYEASARYLTTLLSGLTRYHGPVLISVFIVQVTAKYDK